MKLLVFGDLHLGAGAALGGEPGSRLADQDLVLARILGLACERDVDAVLVAGDIFNGPTVLPEQLDVFARFVDGCDEANLPVVAISGNGSHDAAMRQVNGVQIFDWLPGITVYSRPGLHDLGAVQVACLPWVSPARLVASVDGDVDRDRVNETAARLLVQAASGIADPRIKPTVLMVHASISGASLPAGISTDELREPVLPLADLLDLGYSAIAASHIHVPQYLRRDFDDLWLQPVGDPSGVWAVDEVAAFYTGSPLPLNFGETNVSHGVWILDIADGGAGAEFVPVESRPLVQLDVDYTVNEDASWMDAFPHVGDAIVKLRIRATQAQQRRLDLAATRASLLEAGAHTVKVEVDCVREQRVRVDTVTGDLAPLDAYDAWAEANTVDETLAGRAREQMQADLEAVHTA